MDGEAFQNYEFNERKTIHIDLCLGMKSEENSLQRLQIIKQAQTQLNAEVAQAIQTGVTDPDLFKKMRKPYEDMLYTLGIKECDAYLITLDEVTKMAQQAQQKAQEAAKAAQENPSADFRHRQGPDAHRVSSCWPHDWKVEFKCRSVRTRHEPTKHHR